MSIAENCPTLAGQVRARGRRRAAAAAAPCGRTRAVRAQQRAEVDVAERRRHLPVDHPHHLLGRDAVGGQRGDERTGAGADVDVELVDGAVDGQQVERAQRADLVDAAGEAAAAEHERRLGATAASPSCAASPRGRLAALLRSGVKLDHLAHARPLYVAGYTNGRRDSDAPAVVGYQRGACRVVAAGPRPARARRRPRPRRPGPHADRLGADPAPRGRARRRVRARCSRAAPSCSPPRPRLPRRRPRSRSSTRRPRRCAATARRGTLNTSAVSAAGIGGDGTLGGNLVLMRGGGDPTFGSRAFARRNYGGDASVESLAEKLRAAGLRRVQGNVVGDESAWDALRGVPDKGLGRVDPYVGPLSALSFDRDLTPGGGSYILKPAPYAAGKLVAALKGQGISVAGKATAGPAPAGAKALATVSSPTMGDARRPDQPAVGQLLRREAGQGPGRALRRRRLDVGGRQRGAQQTVASAERTPPSSTARASRAATGPRPSDVVRAAQRRTHRRRRRAVPRLAAGGRPQRHAAHAHARHAGRRAAARPRPARSPTSPRWRATADAAAGHASSSRSS